MHEGNHGILDGVGDIDDIFGIHDEEESSDHDHDHNHGHDHDHNHDHGRKHKGGDITDKN